MKKQKRRKITKLPRISQTKLKKAIKETDPNTDKPKKFENGVWRDSQIKVQRKKEIIKPKRKIMQQKKKPEKNQKKITVVKNKKEIIVVLPKKEVKKVTPHLASLPKKVKRETTIIVNNQNVTIEEKVEQILNMTVAPFKKEQTV